MKNIAPIFLFLIINIFVAHGQTLNHFDNQSGAQHMPGRVIFKLLPAHRSSLVEVAGHPKTHQLDDADLQKLCAAQGQFSVKLLFPQHVGRRAEIVDLSLIGEVIFSESVNVPALCRQFMETGRFEYVEPRMIFKTSGNPSAGFGNGVATTDMLFTPNDPMVGQQWHLDKIEAFDAWDIEQGDTSVLIAIVDTGVDYLHPDLAGNIAVNHADPINGIDDDGNGFEDDYYGWDFFYEDNDPMAGASHGTAVAGVAAAVTNNNLGLAAPGFNSRILAVKVSSDTPGDLGIAFGDQAIVYAADRGCKIINCSWGGPGWGAGLWGDIIEYATLVKDALVVSITHNYNNDVLIYPASAEHVVSVAATNMSDVRESYSNFNHLVDISASSEIWVTTPNGGYANGWTGTSFSAPLVSGAAAILAANDPSLTALQIGQRLRMTSDNIDAQNPNYIERLGRGRLNMFRALTDAPVPAVRFSQALFTDGNDDVFTNGDTLRLSGTFINYLAEVNNLTVTLSTPNSEILFLDSTFSIGLLPTLSEVTNDSEPFAFVIGENTPYDTELHIRLQFQSAGYDDWQWISVLINRTSIDLNNGVIATTITSEGRVGYNQAVAGLGFQYLPNDQVFGVFGLMLGNTIVRVSDAALNSWSGTIPFSNDFKIVEPIHHDTQPLADIGLTCAYNDSITVPTASVMGLAVRQNTYAWMGDHFIITEYEVTNNSDSEYNTFHAGLWGELDLDTYENNRAEQDSALRMGYVYHTSQPSPYAGIQLLGQSPYNLYAYEYSTTYGGINPIDNFSSLEKYKTLTEYRPSAGFDDTDGEDVGLVVSSGPYQLAPGETIKVAFAILAADSLEALRSAAEHAILRYEDFFVGTESAMLEAAQPLKIYPNPAGDMVWIETPGLEIGRSLNVEMYGLSGKMISPISPNSEGHILRVETGHLPAGMYLLRLRTEAGVRTGKFIKQ